MFYLNPLIMAKQQHLDVGTGNNLAPLFLALAASPPGQRGISAATSGQNTVGWFTIVTQLILATQPRWHKVPSAINTLQQPLLTG